MRVFGYLRVSSLEQLDGYSLEAQERAIRQYCASQGWSDPVIFTDRGKSAYTDLTEKRPQFAAMLASAEAGECDVILVHKLDRFARSLITTMREMRRLQKAGVGFVSLSENLDFSSPIGRVILSVLAALAEYYSDNLSTEVKKGLEGRRLAGKPPHSRPYGAIVAGDGLAVDPARAPALARVLELAATTSDVGAALTLNAEGVPPRRVGAWTGVTVREVVTRSRWLREQPEPWPTRYADALARRAPATVRRDRRVRPLTGLMRCGSCGGRIHHGNLRPNGACSIQCWHAPGTARCAPGAPRKTTVDRYEAAVAAWVVALPPADSLRAAAAAVAAREDPAFAALEALRAERERLGLAYADGHLPEATYRARTADLAARERAIPVKATRHARRWEQLAALAASYTRLPPAAQNAVLRELVAWVTITGKECAIEPDPELAAVLAAIAGRAGPG